MGDKYIIKLWTLLTIIVITLTLSLTIFHGHKDRQITKIIINGVDPIAASLALTNPQSNKMTLYLLAKDVNK